MEVPEWYRGHNKWTTSPLLCKENEGKPWTKELHHPTRETGEWKKDKWEETGYEWGNGWRGGMLRRTMIAMSFD